MRLSKNQRPTKQTSKSKQNWRGPHGAHGCLTKPSILTADHNSLVPFPSRFLWFSLYVIGISLCFFLWKILWELCWRMKIYITAVSLNKTILWEKKNPHVGIQPNVWRGLNACVSKVRISKSKSQNDGPLCSREDCWGARNRCLLKVNLEG